MSAPKFRRNPFAPPAGNATNFKGAGEQKRLRALEVAARYQIAEPGDQALLNALGWDGKAQSCSMPSAATALATTMVDGTVLFQAIYLPVNAVLTGVMYAQTVQGSFTNDNNNKLALYTSDGTTLTRVATTANNGSSGTIWERTANTVHKEAFTATYEAQPGLYYIAALANWSAVVTAPTLLLKQSTAVHRATMVNSPAGNKHNWTRSAQTDLGTSFTIASMTSTFDQPIWFALY